MELFFRFGGEMVKVRVQGKDISFANTATGYKNFKPIDKIILMNKGGEEKLKEFKEFMKNIKEEDVKDYIIKELESKGLKFEGVKNE